MGVLDLFRLDGKRAFISGGSRGLGREMALALAEAGADIVLTGRDPESLATTAADIRARGRNASAIACDMSDARAAQDACDRTLGDIGAIDILVNNVGGRRESTPVAEQRLEDWQRLLDLNLLSCFVCTRTIGAAMLAGGRGGRIINIASVSAWKVLPGMGGRHYEAAKAAVLQFTRATAADWAAHEVTVNAICPGIFMTEANERWAVSKPEVMESFLARVPMGRFGRPDEIGALAVYLASDASRYVTGAAFVIDGGFSLL
jgi:NAD(P)-dependent dehydrogenase (short-subunit alcohol dehydrogenase family)